MFELIQTAPAFSCSLTFFSAYRCKMDTTSTVVSIGASDVIVWTLVLVVVYMFIVKRIWNGVFGSGQVSLGKKAS